MVHPHRGLQSTKRRSGAVQGERSINRAKLICDAPDPTRRPFGLVLPELPDMPVHHMIVERISPRDVGDAKHWADALYFWKPIQQFVE
jgi:hypothetical protein